MTSEERKGLIRRYLEGYDEVAKSLEGFPAEARTTRFIPGKWTANEIVHHLADSENISAQRLRQLIAEDHPIIRAYDEANLAIKLRYNERDPAPALESFRTARVTSGQLLERMADDDWKRPGYHTDSGPYDADTWLRIYASHAHNHAAQIVRLRDLALKK